MQSYIAAFAVALVAGLLLTPVVLATARTLGTPARPHAYASAHLANTASLLLPVSNLTNLLAFAASGLTFLGFAAVMALPWLAVIVAEYLVFRWFFRSDLSAPAEPVADGSDYGGSLRNPAGWNPENLTPGRVALGLKSNQP